MFFRRHASSRAVAQLALFRRFAAAGVVVGAAGLGGVDRGVWPRLPFSGNRSMILACGVG